MRGTVYLKLSKHPRPRGLKQTKANIPVHRRVVTHAAQDSGFGTAETDRQRIQREEQAYQHDFARLDKDLWWVEEMCFSWVEEGVVMCMTYNKIESYICKES